MADDSSSGIHQPAFYASTSSKLGDWWTLLHPPYTLWHLGFVGIGAGLAPEIDGVVLVVSLLLFFLAVGIAAHALDEINGRPLSTTLSTPTLLITSMVALLIATVVGLSLLPIGWRTLPLGLLGLVFVFAYNFELFGGRLHTDRMFALQWGAYPVLCGGVLQSYYFLPEYFIAAVAAYFISRAQRELSLRARAVRRRKITVDGVITVANGEAPWAWLFEGCRTNLSSAQLIRQAGFRHVALDTRRLRWSVYFPVNRVIYGIATK